jgi:hypothetical protein
MVCRKTHDPCYEIEIILYKKIKENNIVNS